MSHVTIIMLSIITITTAAVLAVVNTLVVIMAVVLVVAITAVVLVAAITAVVLVVDTMAAGIIDILQGNGEPPNTIVKRLA
jgi:hypothetical protein